MLTLAEAVPGWGVTSQPLRSQDLPGERLRGAWAGTVGGHTAGTGEEPRPGGHDSHETEVLPL